HERAAERLTEAVGAQRSRTAAAEGTLHDEIERAHVRGLVAVDPTAHHGAEVLLHPGGCHFAHDERERLVVVREQRDVRDVALVAGAVSAELSQREPGHGQLTSSSTTRTAASTTDLSMSVGQIDKSSVALVPAPRPAPVMPAGGPERVS